jgi:hypothetical protein
MMKDLPQLFPGNIRSKQYFIIGTLAIKILGDSKAAQRSVSAT